VAPAQHESEAQVNREGEELDHGDAVAVGEDARLIQHFSLATCVEASGWDQ